MYQRGENIAVGKAFVIQFAIIALSVFLITVVAERILIPILKSHKLGQKILDIGPRWHKSKEGTPIMGGLGFIFATLVTAAGLFIWLGIRGESASYVPLALRLPTERSALLMTIAS